MTAPLPPGWEPSAIPSPPGSKHRAYQDTRAAYMDARRKTREHPKVRAAQAAILRALRDHGAALAEAEDEIGLDAAWRAHAKANDDYFHVAEPE